MAAPDRCYPPIFGADNQTFNGRFPIADLAFDHHEYRAAFKAYYQYFFCLNGNSETVNPMAEDSGAAPLLREALNLGINGDLRNALAKAKASQSIDPRFAEAQFIAGNLFFALHDYNCAEVMWSEARQNSGYPSPPDAPPVNSSAQAAQKMLQIHKPRHGNIARSAERCLRRT